jgi:hypothetical protein
MGGRLLWLVFPYILAAVLVISSIIILTNIDAYNPGIQKLASVFGAFGIIISLIYIGRALWGYLYSLR